MPVFFVVLLTGIVSGCSTTQQTALPVTTDGTPASASGVADQGPMSWHVIETGQTLWHIARRYGVPVEAVVRSNPGTSVHEIPAGTLIRLPGLFDQARLIVEDQESGWWPLAGVFDGVMRLSSQEVRLLKPMSTVSGRRVFASNDGIVVLRGHLPVYGQTLIIRHDKECYGVYAGIKSIMVDVGDSVTAGKPIALTTNRPFYFALIPATDGPWAHHHGELQKTAWRPTDGPR